MSNIKTVAELAADSGLSRARVQTLVKNVEPAVKLGRSVGYDEDVVKAAVRAEYADIIEFVSA